MLVDLTQVEGRQVATCDDCLGLLRDADYALSTHLLEPCQATERLPGGDHATGVTDVLWFRTIVDTGSTASQLPR